MRASVTTVGTPRMIGLTRALQVRSRPKSSRLRRRLRPRRLRRLRRRRPARTDRWSWRPRPARSRRLRRLRRLRLRNAADRGHEQRRTDRHPAARRNAPLAPHRSGRRCRFGRWELGNGTGKERGADRRRGRGRVRIVDRASPAERRPSCDADRRVGRFAQPRVVGRRVPPDPRRLWQGRGLHAHGI